MGRKEAPKGARSARRGAQIARMRAPAACCVGCGETAAPRSKETASGRIRDGEIGAGDLRRSEPPRHLSGRTCSGCCTGWCAARRRQRRRRCPHSCGRDCTARCASRWTAKPAPAMHGAPRGRAKARPATGAAGQGERGEPCDRRARASRSPSAARSAREDGRCRDPDVRTRKRAAPPPERRRGPRCAAAKRCIGRPGYRAAGRGRRGCR